MEFYELLLLENPANYGWMEKNIPGIFGERYGNRVRIPKYGLPITRDFLKGNRAFLLPRWKKVLFLTWEGNVPDDYWKKNFWRNIFPN